ncbi:B3 domain-containing protein Os01g0723500-like [Dioscorea cayenensis subsp. rotundata]|uniref:B3 domain-containing protein Os01g0723500-like n=1 Tax=Dioscorea cayennensis subsp. rotundata TaxID=55577 RepID=A0AB40B705_DIOCR|nr:B3 domain-containing protein Os01g0723500-like [Dioscorea cayenensis subsp. rotundata]
MGKAASLMERKPHFFKVLLGDFSQRLGIPVQFLKHISTATSKRVTLQGPSGRCWNAELGKSSKGTFLCGGWAEFAEDHALREYEFLVFQYDGDFIFTVKIFGVNACEREDLFTVIQRKRRKLYEVKDKSRQHVESSLDVGRVLRSQVIKKVVHNDDVSMLGPDADGGNCLERSETLKDVKIKSECDDLPIGIIPSPKKVYKRSCFQKRKLVIHEERSQAPETANSFTSKFPFATVKLCRSHITQPYVMRLPYAFSRTHLPRKKLVLIMKDPNMKSSEVTYIPQKGDADFLSAGWHNFFRGNGLKLGDVCVFELVKPRQLNVHIFR